MNFCMFNSHLARACVFESLSKHVSCVLVCSLGDKADFAQCLDKCMLSCRTYNLVILNFVFQLQNLFIYNLLKYNFSHS